MPGTHQDIGIGACQKMKKKRQKNCEHEKYILFVPDDQVQKFFEH